MCESLTDAKRELERALGPDEFKKYLQLLRKWFSQKLTKEQFDSQARKLIGKDKLRFHNEFFVTILSKCNVQFGAPSSAASGASGASNKRRGMSALKEILKRTTASQSGEKRFRPSEPISSLLAPQEIQGPLDESDNLSACAKDGLLPDRSTMFGRALVIAWESGLDEIEEPGVDLLVLATRDLMKNIMQSAIQMRRNFLLSPDKFPYLFGADESLSSCSTATTTRSIEDSSGDSGSAAAASRSKPIKPMSLRDIYDGLKTRPDVLPCQTIYSVVMERLLCKLGSKKLKAEKVESGD